MGDEMDQAAGSVPERRSSWFQSRVRRAGISWRVGDVEVMRVPGALPPAFGHETAN
jgi:hypothetical protein